MPGKIQRFHNQRGGSVKKVVLDPLNGYCTTTYRRVGNKIHRQLYPNDRYNTADHLILGKKENEQLKAVSKHKPAVHASKGEGVSKQKVSASISKILRGGTISTI